MKNRIELDKDTKKFKIAGSEFEATVRAYWQWDDCPVEDTVDFETEKELEEYVGRFRRGDLLNAVLFVEATFLGQTGTDVLGACHVKDEDDMLEIIKEHGMVDNAVTELIDVLDGLVNGVETTGLCEAFKAYKRGAKDAKAYPGYEYKGYFYHQEKDYEDDNIKIFHVVVDPSLQARAEGRSETTMDWSPYSTPTLEEFRLWVDLGMPGRTGAGPLDREGLEALAAQKDASRNKSTD